MHQPWDWCRKANTNSHQLLIVVWPDKDHFNQIQDAVWNMVMIMEEIGQFLSLRFIATIPLWEWRDLLVSSLFEPGQILVWKPTYYLVCLNGSQFVWTFQTCFNEDTISEWTRVISVVKFLSLACLSGSLLAWSHLNGTSYDPENWGVRHDLSTFVKLFGLLWWFRWLLTS